MADVHDVHEVYEPRRRRRLWPSIVMLLLIILLFGIIVAMIMNIRASISWPAGGVEFGFRPNIYVTRLYPAGDPPAPTRVATDLAPAAKAPAEDVTRQGAVSSAPPQPAATVQKAQPAEAEAPAAETPLEESAAPQ
jgi:hypothetical protein